MNPPKLALSLSFGLMTFLISLALAWFVMLNFNFFYGVWHDHGGIKEGIEKFGPQNRYKPGFADTTKAQREGLFREIAHAIHNDGRGLAEINYQSPSSGGEQLLLREPEVVHLQDVANLINVMSKLLIASSVIWLGVVGIHIRRFRNIPKISEQISCIAGLLAVVGVVLIFAGPENVFNTLHVWVFPSEHQWHFFYQESLMSTMMFAPLLFAWIAGAWVILSLIVFFMINVSIYVVIAQAHRYLSKRSVV